MQRVANGTAGTLRDGRPGSLRSAVPAAPAEVYAWIVRIVRDTGIAEDLTVETFWRIYKHRARFKPDGNFRSWARRIGTNAALDHLRHTRQEIPLPENLPSTPTSDGAVSRETRDSINKAFHELPAKYRLVAMLALVEEENYGDIAQARRNSRIPRKSQSLPRRSNVAKKTQFPSCRGQHEMSNEEINNEMKELLKQAVSPVRDAELRRDLWAANAP